MYFIGNIIIRTAAGKYYHENPINIIKVSAASNGSMCVGDHMSVGCMAICRCLIKTLLFG